MARWRCGYALLAGLVLVSLAVAGGPTLTVESAHGAIEKVEGERLTFQTRGPGGQFGKKLTLRLTGTTKLTSVALEKRGGKLVPVQRDVDAKDLEPGQVIVVIYAGGADPVLLSGVVQRDAAKK